jgi:hypothetical protein
MYAVEIGEGHYYISVRSLSTSEEVKVSKLRNCANAIRVHESHEKMILMDICDITYTIIESVVPWRKVRIRGFDKPPKAYRASYHNDGVDYDAILIGGRIFEGARRYSGDTVFLWDVYNYSVVPLCDKGGHNLKLSAAQWRGSAWVSKNAIWGTQCAGSRELCTLVDLSVARCLQDYDPVEIATGDGRLYGHCVDNNGREFITALDPRESNDAKEVYRDGQIWRRPERLCGRRS